MRRAPTIIVHKRNDTISDYDDNADDDIKVIVDLNDAGDKDFTVLMNFLHVISAD